MFNMYLNTVKNLKNNGTILFDLQMTQRYPLNVREKQTELSGY